MGVRRLFYIVCIVVAVVAGRQRTADDGAVCAAPMASLPAIDVANDLNHFALPAEICVVPPAQTLCQNRRASHIPTCHNYLSAGHGTMSHHWQQRQQFVLHLATTTDAVSAHHYIYALRRILR